MKVSEILRESARLIAAGVCELGCPAISRAAGSDGPAYLRAHAVFRLVGPHRDNFGNPWWGSWESCVDEANRSARVIGLCLAAAIAESEGQ